MLCHLGFPLVPDGLIKSNLLVLDETALLEVLLAVLLLLGLEVGGVGGVAPLGVAMVALDVLVILGLLDHDDLVDTALAGGGDGADVEGNVVATALTGGPGVLVVVGVVVVVVSVVVLALAVGPAGGAPTPLVEREGVDQGLALAVVLGGHGHGGQRDAYKTNLAGEGKSCTIILLTNIESFHSPQRISPEIFPYHFVDVRTLAIPTMIEGFSS